MERFFKLHNEKIIGYKALSEADLGISPTSNQTHIGLFDDILTFLPNDIVIDENAMLIYNNKADTNIPLFFNRIKNPNGSFRSPKIITGCRDSLSIVSTIRNITRQFPQSTWFILWFGLENEQVVFLLFNDTSDIYKSILNEIKIELNFSTKDRIKSSDSRFYNLLNYIESIIDKSTQSIIQELEIDTQLYSTQSLEKKFRKFDIEQANNHFAQIGQLGEQFVANYFEQCKQREQIINYDWCNKNKESSFPYDFKIQDLNDNIIYLDVKSTKFPFEQKIIFSNREIEFIKTCSTNCYNIYRIYDMGKNTAKLRICKSCNTHFFNLYNNILDFKEKLSAYKTELQNASITFKPNDVNLIFEQEIKLSI